MELLIVKTVLDGIRVVRSLVGTRKDLEEAFDFGAQGVVVPVVETVPVDTAVEVFDQMEKVKFKDVKYWISLSKQTSLYAILTM